MLRTTLLFSILFLAVHGMYAQNEAGASNRLAVQQMSPAEAQLLLETKEVDDFSRTLQSLKQAFAAKDTRRSIAYQATLLLSMRTEIDQTSAKIGLGSAEARLEKMNQTLQYFDRSTFDEASAPEDFARMDTFLVLMQEALAELKTIKP